LKKSNELINFNNKISPIQLPNYHTKLPQS